MLVPHSPERLCLLSGQRWHRRDGQSLVPGGTGFGVTKTAPWDTDTPLAPAPALCAKSFISKADGLVPSDHHVPEMCSQMQRQGGGSWEGRHEGVSVKGPAHRPQPAFLGHVVMFGSGSVKELQCVLI